MISSSHPAYPHLLRDAGWLFIVLLLAGLWNLEGPEFWWDEGWTLSVARNFVERGHYGRLLDGQPAPYGLEASPVVTLPVAFMFQVFGIGLWQGRLPGVICAALAVAVVFVLAAQLHDRRIAWGTVAVLLLLPAHPQLNPLLIGRQALGEMPMLLLLAGGYLCLAGALRGRALWIFPAALLWSLALLAKAQTLPFWAASLAGGTLMALALRQWRAAVLVAAGAVLAYGARPWVMTLVMSPVAGRTLPGVEVSGIYEVTAFVPQYSNRLFALQMLLLGGVPTIAGLGYGAWRIVQDVRRGRRDDFVVLRAALLALAGSWLAWYALLSVGVPRYLFPAVFAAGIFTTVLLHDLSGGFRLGYVVRCLAAPLRERRWTWPGAGAWLATLLVAMAVPLTLLSYQRYYAEDDRAALRVAAYLNDATAPDALIETYESELHFLLHRPYHYPPDQVHVELNRRSLLGRETLIAYDPLAADPDYLVVGRFAAGNGLYAGAIAAGAFREVRREGRYVVFERVQ